jgi:thiol-disulfide isomerase/thioredoxin
MKKYLHWIVRILIAILFIVSAYSKMYQFATWQFEKQLIDLGICDWCASPYLARAIIGLEYAIGIGILFNHWIKRLIIPATILLLLAFIAHLCLQGSQYGFTNGNCGCFGQLLPMTPLEAIIKNIITVGMLVYLWFNVTEFPKEKNNLIYPIAIFLASQLFMFSTMPFAPCKKKTTPVTTPAIDTSASDSTTPSDTLQATIKPSDTITTASTISKVDTSKNNKATAAITNTKQNTTATTAVIDNGPTKVKSKFADYSNFNGKVVKVDDGKKIICMFAPGCDHCQGVAKELCKLKSENKNLPEIAILFMDEEAEKIPDFFKFAGCQFTYQVLSIPDFWTILDKGSTPGVFYQHNGNTLKSWEGINENEFKITDLKTLLK